MAESRLIGGYPVIGIRPTIDGRRGALKVRESLEDQTMGMAKAAKKLFEENLRYSNGEPVKVVIDQRCMGTECNRETGSCISGICSGYTCTKRSSCIWNLRT